MPLPNKRIYTIADIYALPEGERAELIDGQLYLMSPPNYKHQKLVMELSSNIATSSQTAALMKSFQLHWPFV